MHLTSKTKGFTNNSVFYEFDNLTFPSNVKNKGLIICYTLCQCCDFNRLSLFSQFKEANECRWFNWSEIMTKETFETRFQSRNDFLKFFDRDDFGLWEINLQWNNIDILIASTGNTKINIRYPKEHEEIDFIPLLKCIEENF